KILFFKTYAFEKTFDFVVFEVTRTIYKISSIEVLGKTLFLFNKTDNYALDNRYFRKHAEKL
ncbi:hypothetical protein, partial [Klebsiella pneumoniae]|uniref:hypothetical protein n=1 Tax=Klebsiella pneumoniae TaxID=573 RepID=UPI001C92CDF0